MYNKKIKAVTLGLIITSTTYASTPHHISTELSPLLDDDILISKTSYDETINSTYMSEGAETSHLSLSVINDAINDDMNTTMALGYTTGVVELDALMIMNDTNEELDATVANVNIASDIVEARGAIFLNDNFNANDLSVNFDFNSILLTYLNRTITSDNGDENTQIASLGYPLTDAIIVDVSYMYSDFEDTSPDIQGDLIDKTSTGFGVSYEHKINDMMDILVGYKQAKTEYKDDNDNVDEEDENKFYLVGNVSVNNIDSTVELSRMDIEDEVSTLIDIDTSYPITDSLDVSAMLLLSDVGDDLSATVVQISAAYAINPSFILTASQHMGESDNRGTKTDIEETTIEIKYIH